MSDFGETCMPFHGQLYGTALYVCRNKADAEDLVQETMLRAMLAWPAFEQGTNVRAWLFTLLTHAYVDTWRKRQVRSRDARARPQDILQAVYGNVMPGTFHPIERLNSGKSTYDAACAAPEVNGLIENLFSDEVRKALDKLGPDILELLDRHIIQGQSYSDIAEDLNVPIGTMMSRLHRARGILDKELRDFAAREYGIKRAG